MTVDERRGDEAAVRIDLPLPVDREVGADARPAPSLGREVDEVVPIEQPGVPDDEVHHRVASFRSMPTSVPMASSQPWRTDASN